MRTIRIFGPKADEDSARPVNEDCEGILALKPKSERVMETEKVEVRCG
jgi:hypothetical protein